MKFGDMSKEEFMKECEKANKRALEKAYASYYKLMKEGKANLCEVVDSAMEKKRWRIALAADDILEGKKVSDEKIREVAEFAVDNLIYIGL